MRILIKNGRLVGTNVAGERPADLLIIDGHVKTVGPNIVDPAADVIDAAGKWVVPGLVDAHVHFRDPGLEYKEDIRSGSRAAAAGGFATVVAEPNTVPPIDRPERVLSVLQAARQKSIVNFYTKAAVTLGINGVELSDAARLKKAGAAAISDDGHPVADEKLMERALRKARECNIVVSPHCEESALYRQREIERLTKKGMPLRPIMPYAPSGVPYTSEAGLIKRDIELAKTVGARIHISHVSLARSVEIIAAAKRQGVRVTAEATPHHFLLTAKAGEEIGPNAKVNPPLRSEEDVAAIKQGLADGTIDIIASDHAPHSPEEKSRSWDDAPFGIIGLETTLGLVMTHLVKAGVLTLAQAIEKMTIAPARIFGLEAAGIGSFAPGTPANLTIIDPDRTWTVDVAQFFSKGRNCPFAGWTLQGRVAATIVAGKIVYKDGRILAD